MTAAGKGIAMENKDASGPLPAMQLETLKLADNGAVPNNPRWPVILYRRVLDVRSDDAAERFEGLFAAAGWGESWRNGIFPYHHFHPRGHEVLGIARGHARVELGGEGGSVLDLAAGDGVLLPAGTGHKLLAGSADLLVIGAYPPGQSADIMRAGTGDAALLRNQVAAVSRPATDPFTGKREPLARLWLG